MIQKETSELVVEEMEVVDTAETSDNSAGAEDVPVVTINEQNEIEDNLPLAVDYLDPTLFKDIRTLTKADLDSSVKQTEVSDNIQDWEQLLLMSICRHNIIANSSFSWWGAYFNSSFDDKIVCYPKKWFGRALSQHNLKDLCPKKWVKNA